MKELFKLFKTIQAPYGKGLDTIVDASVRKTWELDSSQIKITNPDWNDCIKNVLKNVQKKLEIKGRYSVLFL